jgi:hypothetical protein
MFDVIKRMNNVRKLRGKAFNPFAHSFGAAWECDE